MLVISIVILITNRRCADDVNAVIGGSRLVLNKNEVAIRKRYAIDRVAGFKAVAIVIFPVVAAYRAPLSDIRRDRCNGEFSVSSVTTFDPLTPGSLPML